METIGRSGRHRLHWLSLNGDSPVGPQNRTRNDPIRVNSCPFVGFYCMDVAAEEIEELILGELLVDGGEPLPSGPWLIVYGTVTSPVHFWVVSRFLAVW